MTASCALRWNISVVTEGRGLNRTGTVLEESSSLYSEGLTSLLRQHLLFLPTSQSPSVLDREERVKVRTDKSGNFCFITPYFLGKSQKGFNARFHNSCFALLLLLKLQGVDFRRRPVLNIFENSFHAPLRHRKEDPSVESSPGEKKCASPCSPVAQVPRSVSTAHLPSVFLGLKTMHGCKAGVINHCM